MDARAPAVRTSSLERDWWLRALAVFQSPKAVFAAMRDDSDEAAEARQEPILALVFLAGIGGILAASSTMGTLLDDPARDGVVVALLLFLAGGLYGMASYWIGGAALYVGARGAGAATSYRRVRHVLAFAAAPLALSLPVVLPLRLAAYGGDIFRRGGSDESGAARWLFETLELGFGAWAVVLLVVGLQAVYRWSLLRSLGALVITAFAVLALAIPFVISVAGS